MSGTPHKHRDVIIAWANGEEIEHLDEQGWFAWDSSIGFTPDFNCGNWRIKPKIVKREGWVNVYKDSRDNYWSSDIHLTEQKADEVGRRSEGLTSKKVACIRIEWEEQE